MKSRELLEHVYRYWDVEKHYEEESFGALVPPEATCVFLDLCDCGTSFFKQGAVVPIWRHMWVVEYQISGRCELRIAGGGSVILYPGDVYLTPPEFRYSYCVQEPEAIRKSYVTFRSSPALDILFQLDSTHGGIVLRKLPEVERMISDIRSIMLSGDAERLSVALYALAYHLRAKLPMQEPLGNFHEMLRQIRMAPRLDSSLEELAKRFRTPRHTLIRTFQRELSMTPMQYMIQQRMLRASQLLQGSQIPVVEIAELCGYGSCAYFTSVFRKHFGMTPSSYRKSKRKG